MSDNYGSCGKTATSARKMGRLGTMGQLWSTIGRGMEGATSIKKTALKILATAAFATVAAALVFAANMAPRYTTAPPRVVAVYDWTGFYIGGNAGSAATGPYKIEYLYLYLGCYNSRRFVDAHRQPAAPFPA